MPRLKRKPYQIDSDIYSSWYYQSRKKAKKELCSHRIDQLFESYMNKSSGLIELEGIETLCKDLHVDYKGIGMLILACLIRKMKAEKQGFISKDEWRRGLKLLDADTITDLKAEIHMIKTEEMQPQVFEDCYSYVFLFLEDKQGTLDIETACELLNVVLRHLFPTRVDLLVEFLKIQNEYGAINIYQWSSFYPFCKEWEEEGVLSLLSYGPSQSWRWPLIIDNFVEWLKEKQKDQQLYIRLYL